MSASCIRWRFAARPITRGMVMLGWVVLGSAALAAVPRADADAAAQGEGAPPRVAEIVAGLQAREAALTSIRGFVAYEFDRSETALARLQDALRRKGRTDIVVLDRPRTICVAQFLAGQDLFRMDGLMLNDGGGCPWGLTPWRPWKEGAGGGPTAGAQDAPKRPCRTVIIRDGEHETTYWEGAGMEIIRPLATHAPAVGQGALGEFLFCDRFGKGLSALIRADPRPDTPGRRQTFECLYEGDEDVEGVRCAKLQMAHRSSDLGIPATLTTLWLASDMGFAPLRAQSVTWYVKADGASAAGEMWGAGGYQELQQGLWLPHRVRVQRARAYKGGPKDGAVEWEEIHVAQYFGLDISRAVNQGDVRAWKAPINTRVSDEVGAIAEIDDRGCSAARKAADAALAAPPVLQLEPAFTEFMRECAKVGPPTALAAP